MAQELKDGQLGAIIRKNTKKLVAVDFGNPGCPPCRAIKPWWNQLPAKYPNIVFCSIECESCPSDAQQHGITATPTFVFFLNGAEIKRITGPNKAEITAVLEKHKNSGAAFSGTGRSLGSASNSNNNAAPPPKVAVDDNYVRDMLLEMGFPLSKVTKAMSLTNNGNIDDCVLELEKLQRDEERAKALQNPEAEKAKLAELQRKAAERRAQEEASKPKTESMNEMQRRAEVQEQQNIKKDLMAQRAKAEEDNARRERIAKLQEKKQILDRIQQQHGKEPEPQTEKAAPPPPPASAKGSCTLKIVFPDGNNVIAKFSSEETLNDVEEYLVQNIPVVKGKKMGFETMYPQRTIGREEFETSLAECNLCPRAQILVVFL